jgi:hypothetical protein
MIACIRHGEWYCDGASPVAGPLLPAWSRILPATGFAGAGSGCGSRPGQPARRAIRPCRHAAGPASRRSGRELAGGTG